MNEKERLLKQYFGHNTFRPAQESLIDALLAGKDVVGIMPTGSGKSVCYQIPALMSDGLTLVVSPLISLMKDQVDGLNEAGVCAAYINSSLTYAQQCTVLRRAASGSYDIVYIAPERMMSEDFIEFARNVKIAFIAVDEAHCISQWGQDFRPSYTKISEFVDMLPSRPPIGAFTATATQRVLDDIVDMLHLNAPSITITGFDRPNLSFEVISVVNRQKPTVLTGLLSELRNKSGIVYCSTRKNVEEVTDILCNAGIGATRYHAGLSDSERKANQEAFLYDEKPIIVATNAFGMGIDKSNVAFVIHYNMPLSIENYYQEAGRAGRDGSSARCVVLYSKSDVRINTFIIEKGNEEAELPEDIKKSLLEADKEKLKQMTFYCVTSACLRKFLLNYFGENAPENCANCSNCNGNFDTLDVTVDAQKIVSCVWRLEKRGRHYGKTMLCDILRGSNSERILSARLNEQPTYGIMKSSSSTYVRNVMEYLIMNGYLAVQTGDYPLIELTEKSREIVFDRVHVTMHMKKELHERVRQDSYEHDDLYSLLAKLRTSISIRERVPVYIVFSDATLRDMCRVMPQDKSEFLTVSGVGEYKAKRYGDEFLEVIHEYITAL